MVSLSSPPSNIVGQSFIEALIGHYSTISLKEPFHPRMLERNITILYIIGNVSLLLSSLLLYIIFSISLKKIRFHGDVIIKSGRGVIPPYPSGIFGGFISI